MKRIFDKPQLKEGTYRAFIFEPGHIVIVFLVEDMEEAFVTSSKDFSLKVINEIFDYNISYDALFGVSSISKLVAEGCEEVII